MNARIWKYALLFFAVPLFIIGAYLLLDWLHWQGHAESSTDIVLELVCEQSVVKVGKSPMMAVFVVNRGDTKVLLVEPGDGSTEGWRTPTIEWSHGVAIPGGRCGNVNALKPKELFMLEPGESRRLSGWIHSPHFTVPGRFQVSVRYVNNPDHKWSGIPLGMHNAWAMRQVRRSTQVSAVSNTVEIVVEE